MCIKLSYEQYEFIKGEVVALFERYEIRKVPINGFELAKKMGIELKPFSSLDEAKLTCAKKLSTDGFFIEDNYGNNFIYYNDIGITTGRINMTILHEIGHCVLDHTGRSPEEEAEAAFFAKYAIAPPPLINLIHPRESNEIEYFFGLSNEASIFSFNYYKKWISLRNKNNKEYEVRLLSLFNDIPFLKGGAKNFSRLPQKEATMIVCWISVAYLPEYYYSELGRFSVCWYSGKKSTNQLDVYEYFLYVFCWSDGLELTSIYISFCRNQILGQIGNIYEN